MSNNHPIQNGGGGGGMNVGFGSTEYYFGADPTSGESKAMVSLPTFEEGQRLVNEEHTTYDKHTILPQLPPTSSQLFQDKPQIFAAPKATTYRDDRHRKLRKNAKSRERAKELKQQVQNLKIKPDEAKTPAEVELEKTVEERRVRKNNRSKERALEKKREIERILSIPEASRTPEDTKTLEDHKAKRKRKSEGDKLRRQRMRHLGLKNKPDDMSLRAQVGSEPSDDNIPAVDGMLLRPSHESAFVHFPDVTLHPGDNDKEGNDTVAV